MHRDGEERKILLRERPVKFHVVMLIEPNRTHIADHPDDLDWHTPARDEQRLADRIFVAENRLRSGCADENYVWMIGDVLLIEIAAGEERNAERAKPSRCDVI